MIRAKARMGVVGLIGWLWLVGSALAQAAPLDDLLTVAERSDFRATARHAEVVALCERLAARSPLIKLAELGKSGEGRSIPLMIVADPPVGTPAEARASGKLVIFLVGNIHAGEVCGKEALPIFVRELTDRPDHPLLKHLILLVAPIFNADGNERVSKTNRPGQVGPVEGVGQRPNAAGLDLNRDFMKLEAPETRALVRLLNEWDPALTVDTHTTNGSHHRYAITYDGPKNPAGDSRLLTYSRNVLFPGVTEAFTKQTGRNAYFYGNFESDHTRWTTYPSTPRFGTTYIGLRNRLSVLSEAYSYSPYDVRVWATRDFCRTLCEFAADHRAAIRALLDEVRRANPAPRVAIRSEPRALPGKVPILGFVERPENGRSVATSEPRDYLCSVEGDFQPTVEVNRPTAYLVPARFPRAVELLQAHGITVNRLEAAERRTVTIDRVDATTRSNRRFEGHDLVEITATTPRTETREVPAGTVVVPTTQSLGNLVVYLLEPRSDDGLATWNHFDAEAAPGRDFPIEKVFPSP